MWPDWLRPHCIMDVFPSALKATLFNWTARDGFESGLKQCLNTARGWRSQATGLKEHQTLTLIIKTNNLRLWAVEGRQAAAEHTLCWISKRLFQSFTLILTHSLIKLPLMRQPWVNMSGKQKQTFSLSLNLSLKSRQSCTLSNTSPRFACSSAVAQVL